MEELSLPDGVLTSIVRYDSPESLTTFTAQELSKRAGSADFDGIAFQGCEAIIEKRMTAEEILHEILPARYWEASGKKWRQTVSTVPATRSDVIRLQELVDRKLKEHKARELGLDNIRREIYAEFFDELIRQVTVESSERGLMLYRIKKEFLQTIREYEAIYESAVTYGMRKKLTYDQDREKLKLNLYDYPTEIEELKLSISNLKSQIQDAQEAAAGTREELIKSREEDIANMKAANETMKAQIWSIASPKNVNM